MGSLLELLTQSRQMLLQLFDFQFFEMDISSVELQIITVCHTIDLPIKFVNFQILKSVYSLSANAYTEVDLKVELELVLIIINQNDNPPLFQQMNYTTTVPEV